MTPNDLRLIRSSCESLARDPDGFAAAFRQRMVALDPTLGALVPRAGFREAALVETLARLVDGLDCAGSAAAKARTEALRHRWAGLQPRHYAKIGQALLDAMSSCLGSPFGDDARAACADALIMLAEDLMARSYNPLGLVA